MGGEMTSVTVLGAILIAALILVILIAIEYYGLCEDGEVFIYDGEGQGHKVQEALAKKVRAAIKRGEAMSPEAVFLGKIWERSRNHKIRAKSHRISGSGKS
jgi:hypothetical protein